MSSTDSSSSAATKTITTAVDAALTFATFASFGFGPAGFVLAGLSAMVETVFNACMASSPAENIVTDVGSLMQSDLEVQQIHTATDAFKTYATWFSDTYQTAQNAVNVTPIPSDVGTLSAYTYLQEAASSPNAPLLQAISSVQSTTDNDFAVRAFHAFLYGAGLHMTMFKAYLLINAFAKKGFDAEDTSLMREYVDGYISYASNLVQYIETQISNRLGMVSQLESDTESGGSITEDGLVFYDAGPPIPFPGQLNYGDNEAGFRPGQIVFVPNTGQWGFSAGTPNTPIAQADLNAYLAALTTQQHQQYGYTQPDAINACIAHWKTVSSGLQAIQNHPGATT